MVKLPLKLTFEDYLKYDDGTDYRYELVDGELVQMTPASPQHVAIIRFLFLRLYSEILRGNLDGEVFQSDIGIRTGALRSRLPDICVIKGSDWRELRSSNSSSAILENKSLVLAVEVVIPGEKAYNRDYLEKSQEYAQKQIPEYWIVDPITENISILILVGDRYQACIYQGSEQIISPTFPQLNLSVAEILSV